MKQNDVKLLHGKSVSELEKMVKDTEEEIFKLKKELKEKKLKNTSLIKNKLDDLARIQTELSLKQN